MSKCDIRITFDKDDRKYAGGDTVSGEVHIQVNKDIRCNGIILTHYWKTHGRGNTDQGEKHQIRLSEMEPLQAGEELHLPFEFVAEQWPLTYHGHHIYIDHYVHVAVDVPWAIDPNHEEEYLLLPGERPPEISGSRTEIAKVESKAVEVTGIAKYILLAIVGIVLFMFAMAFVFLIPIFLIAGCAFGIWKMMIASRVGNVTLTTPHVVVAPGEPWPVELSFTPRKTFLVNGITLRIMGREAATSGSGTNSTTHHHELHDETHVLYDSGQLMAGEQFSERFVIDFPETDAWSFDDSDNDIDWWAEVRIDIPRFPDWKKTVKLQVLPPDFFEPADAGQLPHSGYSPVENFDGSPAPPSQPNSSSQRMSQVSFDDVTADSGVGDSGVDDMAPLLAVIDRIHQAGRFGNERSEIVSAASGHAYDTVVIVDRISTTFGFVGDDDRYEDGKTIIGRVAGTDQEIQLFTVEASNDALHGVSRGDEWQTVTTVENWDTLYDRLVLHEAPFD